MEAVSAVLIVKNAADDLPRCLDCLKWVSEIVVVDSFSSDNTVEIARRYTDKIIQREWPGYANQKNYAISQAAGPWILSVDADEVLPPETVEEIKRVLSAPSAVGFRFPRRNIFLGHWVQGCGWYPDWQLRLFKKGAGWFRPFNVHESVEVEGPVGVLNNPIFHYSYKSLSHYFGKSNNYTNLEVADLAESSSVVSDLDPFRRFCDKFVTAFITQQGWRDGTHGLAISTGLAIYEFSKYLKALYHYEQSGRHNLIRWEGANITALKQFKEALFKISQIQNRFNRHSYPQSYTGLNESLSWLVKKDVNSFLGEANRLSDRDADNLVQRVRGFVDREILTNSLNILKYYPDPQWPSVVLAMGAFIYAFMVWSKVWERLIWNWRQAEITETLSRNWRAAYELSKSIQWASRYLWFARRG
ncbi:MAG: glycosyltransferase family 2 protein [Firmicutes bacterium]|nr:glycosyltransferase family 2 protein [Bacillota bacterium]